MIIIIIIIILIIAGITLSVNNTLRTFSYLSEKMGQPAAASEENELTCPNWNEPWVKSRIPNSESQGHSGGRGALFCPK